MDHAEPAQKLSARIVSDAATALCRAPHAGTEADWPHEARAAAVAVLRVLADEYPTGGLEPLTGGWLDHLATEIEVGGV